MYMDTLPLAEVRAQLSKLVDDAVLTHERVEITRNGRRAAVLLSADDFDSLQETIEVLGDRELLGAHMHGVDALSEGDTFDADQLGELMAQRQITRS